nr:transglycosylase domain-containing protein [Myxococcota bacterium]
MLVIFPFRWIDPPTSAFMLRETRARGQAVQHRFVDGREISPHLSVAVLAAEDQRFPTHGGLDWKEIGAALEDSLDGSPRGASTLSQQLAKNLFLWPGRSWLRKGLEAWFTV